MIRHLAQVQCDSISGIARSIGEDTANVYKKLAVAKRLGHVTEKIGIERNPITLSPTKVHKVYITEAGKRWLKELS